MPNVKAPSSDAAYAEWLANLAELASKQAENLPLTTLQIANLEAMSRLFSNVLAESEQSKAQWKQDVQDKNYLRKEAQAHCERYLQQILADSTVPEGLKVELGLAKPTVRKSKPLGRVSSTIQSSHAYA